MMNYKTLITSKGNKSSLAEIICFSYGYETNTNSNDRRLYICWNL